MSPMESPSHTSEYKQSPRSEFLFALTHDQVLYMGISLMNEQDSSKKCDGTSDEGGE